MSIAVRIFDIVVVALIWVWGLAPDKDDRRKVIVELTQEGLDLLDRVIPRAHTISELTMGNLNPAERVAIVYLLRKMIDSTLDMSDKE